MRTKTADLVRITLKDLLDAYPRNPAVRLGLSAAFFLPALVFSRRLERFSRDIGVLGLREAARGLLGKFYLGVRVRGDGPPGEGGLLVLCNHPGVGDSLALLSALERRDARIVAGEREFFRALPELSDLLIPVPDDPGKRIGTLRAMARDLKAGRTVVLYPAGSIEPDPLLHPDEEPLKPWSSAAGLLVLLAAREGFRFSLKPVLVGGVLPPHAVGGPPSGAASAETAPTREVREKRAVGRIIGLAAARRDTIALAWGRTFPSEDFAGRSAGEITALIMAEAAGLLREEKNERGPWSHPSRETPRPG